MTLIFTTSSRLRQFTPQDSQRVEVTGTVQYLGVPVATGTIRFGVQFHDPQYYPTDVEASITDGSFAIPKHSGTEPGSFLLTIRPDWPEGPRPPTEPGIYRCEPDRNGVITAPLGSLLLVEIKPQRANQLHIRLN